MTRRILPLFFVTALAACSEKPAPTDDFTELDSADEKSDIFSTRWRLLGTLRYGDTSPTTEYQAPPRYRAFKFTGASGDKVTLDAQSKDGDTVLWLLNSRYEIVAANDDANRNTTNSHLDLTLKTSGIHYIVVREYLLARMSFTVTLKGQSVVDFYSCQRDADCVRIESGCCPLGRYTAVRADKAQAFTASLGCAQPLICPKVLTREDYSVAECLENRCVAVLPKDVACGGKSANPHKCPGGFRCEGQALLVDGTGKCSQECGGIAGLTCFGEGQFCVDDPADNCNPQAGGRDCIGVCRDAICNGKTAKCAAGFHWDQFACNCVENTSCGGFANFPCSANRSCVDDPRDNCDPLHGGADCPGVCVPKDDCRATGCKQGSKCSVCWDPSKWVCLPNGAVC